MKTRVVKIIGVLTCNETKYRLVRIEPLTGFATNVMGFTVTNNMPKVYSHSTEDKNSFHAPFLLVTTAPWTVEYCKEYEILVEDDTQDDEEVKFISKEDAEFGGILNDNVLGELTNDEWRMIFTQADNG